MQLTTSPDIGAPETRFLPAGFDPSDPEAVAAQVERLLERPIDGPSALEAWILDRGELGSIVGAGLARRYIAMTCDTKDDSAKESYLSYQKNVIAPFRDLDNRLNEKFLSCPHLDALPERYALYVKRKRKEKDLYREENTPLHTKDSELSAKYAEIQGAVTVEFRGETLTAQQVGAKLEETDRDLREDAWRSLASRRQQDAPKISDLFDEMVALRTKIARNAGFDDYRDYRFEEFQRFDYGPEDCFAFHDAVEKHVVPAVLEIAEWRKNELGLPSLRPWDFAVDPTGRPPLRPFGDQGKYIRLVRRLFHAVDPGFEDQFDVLVRNGLLDLMSRRGKAPGGYQYQLEDIRLPFIFINAVGTHGDIQTLLHEGGHSFHSMACRNEELSDYRHPPIEFAEVASMGMEMLGIERFGEIYDEEEARNAQRQHLTRVISVFAWVATVDAFQHWVYTHPEHSREERAREWLRIRDRFAPHIDWTGLEEFRPDEWQRQGHIFGHAFYYIEYAIAQIGALQVWRNEKRDHGQAVTAYRKALALGGSRPLPELFETAGLRFAMDDSVLGELIPMVMKSFRALI